MFIKWKHLTIVQCILLCVYTFQLITYTLKLCHFSSWTIKRFRPFLRLIYFASSIIIRNFSYFTPKTEVCMFCFFILLVCLLVFLRKNFENRISMIRAVVAEWLRRLTRNQFLSEGVGSNPTNCELFCFCNVCKTQGKTYSYALFQVEQLSDLVANSG